MDHVHYSANNGLTWPCRCGARNGNFYATLKSFGVFIFLISILEGPIFVVLISSQNIGKLLVSILLLLILVTTYAITQILFITNESNTENVVPSSVNHLVNHRFHPICYFSIISIVSVLYFSIGLIGAGYTGVDMTSIDWFHACFELLGFILISTALVFPASLPEAGVKIPARVDKNNNDLRGSVEISVDKNPLTMSKNESKTDEEEAWKVSNDILGMTPANWYGTVPEKLNTEKRLIESLRVFNISGKYSSRLGTMAFLLGYLMEIVTLVAYFTMLPRSDIFNDWWRIYIMAALGFSFGCFVVFFGYSVNQLIHSTNSFACWQLFCQLIAIFFIVMGVIMKSLGEGNLITTFGNYSH